MRLPALAALAVISTAGLLVAQQPQQPPPQQPPPPPAATGAGLAPPTETGVKTRVVSRCPDGQDVCPSGYSCSPRRTSNTASQVRQR